MRNISSSFIKFYIINGLYIVSVQERRVAQFSIINHFNLTFSADQVSEFLRSHPDFLERYVMEEVELEQLERWIIRRSQRLKKKPESAAKNGRKTSLSRWKFCVHADKRQMLQDLTHSLQLKPTKDHVLWELANCICSAVNADGFR